MPWPPQSSSGEDGHFSKQWAAEGRYQYGKADSNYGEVKATVLGLRSYRFFSHGKNRSWYLGGEAAYAHAKASHAIYETQGLTSGAFGGLEYHILPRLAVGADIGPYIISLKEKASGLGQTNLDFIVNTAVHWFLF